jgi:uncharacterized protein (DUF58 family)
MMTAAAVFGIDTKHSNTYQLFVFLFMLLVFSLLNSLFTQLKVQLKRHIPRYGTVGESLTYTVTVTNLSHKNYDGLSFIEQLDEAFPTYQQLKEFYQLHKKSKFRHVASFKNWWRYIAYHRGGTIAETSMPFLTQSPMTLTVGFIPLRRGKLKFSTCYIAKPDLLGLYRRLIPLIQTDSCLILPKRYPIHALALTGKRKYQVGGVTLANSVGDAAEFMSLRDYQPGDPLKRIHWKSFAKHGKLIVKEYQDEYFVRRALLLDTFIGNAEPEQFEAAVSVAASLAMSEQQSEALLDLVFAGDKAYCFTTGRGVDHLPHLQEILATVPASTVDNFEPLQQAVLNRIEQCSSFVCVLMHWDQTRQNLIKQLQTHDLPVAVFLLQDGSLTLEQCVNKPELFYLLNYQQLEAELAAL